MGTDQRMPIVTGRSYRGPLFDPLHIGLGLVKKTLPPTDQFRPRFESNGRFNKALLGVSCVGSSKQLTRRTQRYDPTVPMHHMLDLFRACKDL